MSSNAGSLARLGFMESLEEKFGSLAIRSESFLTAQVDDKVVSLEDTFKVYLNLEFMQDNGLSAGTRLLLTSGEAVNKFCVFVWPSLAIAKNDVKVCLEFARLSSIQQSAPVYWTKFSSALVGPEVISSLTIICKENLKDSCIDSIRRLLLATRYLRNGQVFKETSHSPCFKLSFERLNENFFLLSNDHELIFKPAPLSTEVNREEVNLTSSRKEMIKSLILSSVSCGKSLLELGLKPSCGILLYGPTGTGKTSLAREVCQELGFPSFFIEGDQFATKYYGESEKLLDKIYKEAAQQTPSIIFIDDIDELCPRRSQESGSQENRLITSLLALMDGYGDWAKAIYVIAATKNILSVDPALRRPGRLDREFEIGPPSFFERKMILERLLDRLNNNLTSSLFEEVANKTAGFVHCDLNLLVKEGLLRMKSDLSSNGILTYNHLCLALGAIKPSSLRESLLEIPQLSWSSIAGQEETKGLLKESVELPLKFPEKFIKLGIKPPKGVLLYGPPGCSKTLLAKALASESGLNFLAIKGPEIFSKWVGDSEKSIRDIFRKARMAAPSDEIDAISSSRGESHSVSDRVVSQLLCELDGIDELSQVTVIAATNRPGSIDRALLRPGRFDRHVYVKLPDYDTRFHLFSLQSDKYPFASSISISWLANATSMFSGAEIVHLCQEAAYNALSRSGVEVIPEDFSKALAMTSPRITSTEIEYFNHFSFENVT